MTVLSPLSTNASLHLVRELLRPLRCHLANQGSFSDPNVIQELCSILSGFPFLIEKFATVLPGSSSLEVPKDFAMTRVVGIKREGEVLAWRAAFGVTSTCKSDELSPTDDKILCLLRSALATPEREDAVQTLRKEDARRTLDLMQKVRISA